MKEKPRQPKPAGATKAWTLQMSETTEAELQARYERYRMNSIGKLIDNGYSIARMQR